MSADVRHVARVPEWKLKEVDELVERIKSSRVVGVAGIRELPASEFQRIRGILRPLSEVRVVNNNIARRAILKSDESIRPLADYIEDQTALIFSDANPFALKKMLDAEKRPMPIKAGAVAPMDIVVESGETSFSPGPMVGKLQSAGIPAAIKGGKVVINQRVVLAKKGDVITPKVAEVLQLMEIYPKLVGLELRAAYSDRLVFAAEDLTLDVDAVLRDISEAAGKALAFAVEVAYVTPQTVAPIVQRAASRARYLVAERGIPVPGMMDLVIMKAHANAQAIASLISGGESAPEQKQVEEVVEEVEEKKEEEDAAAGLGSLFG